MFACRETYPKLGSSDPTQRMPARLLIFEIPEQRLASFVASPNSQVHSAQAGYHVK